MSHVWMSQVSHVNEVCLNIRMSHVARGSAQLMKLLDKRIQTTTPTLLHDQNHNTHFTTCQRLTSLKQYTIFFVFLLLTSTNFDPLILKFHNTHFTTWQRLTLLKRYVLFSIFSMLQLLSCTNFDHRIWRGSKCKGGKRLCQLGEIGDQNSSMWFRNEWVDSVGLMAFQW